MTCSIVEASAESRVSWRPRWQVKLIVRQAPDESRSLRGALANEIDDLCGRQFGREPLGVSMDCRRVGDLLADREADDPLMVGRGLDHMDGFLADRPGRRIRDGHPALAVNTLENCNQSRGGGIEVCREPRSASRG